MKRTILYGLLSCMLIFFVSSCSFIGGQEDDYTPTMLFNSMWENYDKTYALFNSKNIDWNAVKTKYAPEISDGMSSTELFDVCADMICELHDRHVYLQAPFDYCNSGGRFETVEPFSLQTVISNYLTDSGTAGKGMFTYGRLKSDTSTGYIYIAGFSYGKTTLEQTQDWTSDINSVLEKLSDTDAIILDIRGNRGGLAGNVSYLASKFASEEKVYAVTRTKNGPGSSGFSDPVELFVEPADGTRYTKKVILVTNGQTISGGEYFVLALRTQSHVIQTGSTTAGAFSLSLERVLPNGWRYSVSVQKVTDAAGVCYENTGIRPVDADFVENTADGAASGTDAQLEYALSLK